MEINYSGRMQLTPRAAYRLNVQGFRSPRLNHPLRLSGPHISFHGTWSNLLSEGRQ